MSKAAAKKKVGAPKFGDNNFINYSLSNEQKAELKAKPFSPEDFDSLLDQVTDSGYKVSFSYDTFNECYAVFLTPKDEKSINKGLILTARGSTNIKAFKQACYLHFTLFDENWADFYEVKGKEPIDD